MRGRLMYVQDGVHDVDRFAHAQGSILVGLKTRARDDPFNYLRNSVKVTMEPTTGR